MNIENKCQLALPLILVLSAMKAANMSNPSAQKRGGIRENATALIVSTKPKPIFYHLPNPSTPSISLINSSAAKVTTIQLSKPTNFIIGKGKPILIAAKVIPKGRLMNIDKANLNRGMNGPTIGMVLRKSSVAVKKD